MTDFEVHPRGTTDEITASRALAREIEQITEQYGKVIPGNVMKAYERLTEIYKNQLEGYYD